MQAVGRKYREIVEILLNHPNIDVTIKNNYGQNALDMANDNQVIIDMIDGHLSKQKK
jgi:hypothetical protein